MSSPIPQTAFSQPIQNDTSFGAKFSNFFANYGGPLALGAGLVKTGYDMYWNKKNFDYQKSLQQEIFNREDTAIQRRVDDMLAAGINPNLAAGSGANAGSVVGRSTHGDVNMGASIDYMNAINQQLSIRQDIQTKKYINEQERIKTQEQKFTALRNIHEMLAEMGIPSVPLMQNGEFVLNMPDGYTPTENSIYDRRLENEIAELKHKKSLRPYDLVQAESKINEITTNINKITHDMQLGNIKFDLDYLLAQNELDNDAFYKMLDSYKAITGYQIDKEELEIAWENVIGNNLKRGSDTMIGIFKALPLLIFLLGGL